MNWLGDHPWALWLIVAVVLGTLEMASLDLVLLMLASGAMVGALAAALDAPFVVQAILAAATAVGMLAFVRPSVVKRLHSGPTLVQGHAKLIGQRGLVTVEITPMSTGRVTLAGETWSAAPYDPTTTISPGETVEVLEIRGATALVHPVPSLES